MKVVQSLLLAGLAYLLGSVPFSYLVARARGVDLRTTGSGNIGGGNVWRTCGFGPFLVAITLDIAKGATLPLLAMRGLKLPPLAVVLTGAGAMLGHSFSLFMGFRGGKAVATGGGVLLAIFPPGILAGAASWFVTVFFVRITSVGSLVAATVAVMTALVAAARKQLEPIYALFVCAAGGMVIFLHRANIRRLLEGTENRVEKLF
jgi:glycerol-3-phosphate acyltransferase PlsY